MRVSGGDLCIRKYAEALTEPAGETFHARPSEVGFRAKPTEAHSPRRGASRSARARLDFAQTKRRITTRRGELCSPAEWAMPVPYTFIKFTLRCGVPAAGASSRPTGCIIRAVLCFYGTTQRLFPTVHKNRTNCRGRMPIRPRTDETSVPTRASITLRCVRFFASLRMTELYEL